jgi:hypothetical protein
MTDYKDLWSAYPKMPLAVKVYIDRLKTDGTYEGSWTRINQNLISNKIIGRVAASLPNSDYAFGQPIISDAVLSIVSTRGEFSNEDGVKSLFKGFLRDRSQLKVTVTFTNPEDSTDFDEVTIVKGLIDGAECYSEETVERVKVQDFIKLLKDKTLEDRSMTSGTADIDDAVLQAMNDPYFTRFFTVSAGNINSGLSYTVDYTQYDAGTTIYDFLVDISKGVNVVEVGKDTDTFIYEPATPTPSVQYEFLEKSERKVRISKKMDGTKRQWTVWSWAGTNLTASTPAVNSRKANPFSIAGVTVTGDREDILGHLLNYTKFKRQHFLLRIPIFPVIKIRDRVKVRATGIVPENVARYGSGIYGKDVFGEVTGITISESKDWVVRSVKHSVDFTDIECEEILS